MPAFRHTRAFDWRRVGIYLLGSAVLVGLSVLVTVLIAPEATGWGTFLNALGAGDESTTLNRAVGAGPGAYLIILMVMNVSVVVLVWLVERARRKRSWSPTSR